MALTPIGSVAIPPFRDSAFDHGDVHLASGRIFVAHTAGRCIEVIDPESQLHIQTIEGCPEASGVLCAQDQDAVFAASRGAGKVLVIDPATLAVRREMACGPRPNGLAWDARRRLLLVADVEDFSARALDPQGGGQVAQVRLPGRPRWCAYDREGDHFLVNIREPACVAVLTADPLALVGQWPVSSDGPHGLDLDARGRRAFVACDGGMVTVLDLGSGVEVGCAPIAGPPDAIWYNAERRRLYVAIAEPGMVEVIDTETMTAVQRLVTEAGAHTTAFDRARQRLIVFLAASCQAAIYRDTWPCPR